MAIFGYAWLKSNSAGSGPFALKSWKPNEAVDLEANPDDRHGAPGVKRVVLRHVPEPAAQRLMLEKGDADFARNLTADQIQGIAGNADWSSRISPRPTFTIWRSIRRMNGWPSPRCARRCDG